jgi:CubicO group peptidase (beta-lactamase class C family)
MVTLSGRDLQRIRDAAGEVVAEHHLPGIAIGVVAGDDLVFSEGFGYADIETRVPQDPARRQRIASVTKTMAGLCVMALVDEGRLRLDDRVVDLLPDVTFDGPAETMTVRHLLTHTSGIGEAPTRDTLAAVAAPDRGSVKEPGEFATLYPKGIVVEAAPGTKWAYCNNGYALLGEIVVRTEHAPLQDVMQRRIFEPLSMRDTDILDMADARLTTPYHRPPSDDNREQFARAGIPVPDEPFVDGQNIRGEFRAEFNKGMLAAGAVQSNVPDMARYASALLRRGGGIVRPETFEAMIAPQYAPDARLVSWGLAFSRTPRFGRQIIGHGGAFFGGWNTNFAIIPGENMAVLQHMNIMLDSSAPIFNRILRAVFDAPPDTFPERPVDPAVLASAPGLYECAAGTLTNFRPATRVGRVHIAAEGGALVLRSRWGAWKGGVRMTPAGASDPAFFAVQTEGRDPAYIALTRDASGRVDGLRCDELYHMVRRDTPAD